MKNHLHNARGQTTPRAYNTAPTSHLHPKHQSHVEVAIRSGSFSIGEHLIDCSVLPNGTRVLSERSVHRLFRSKRGGAHYQRKKKNEDGAFLPSYLSPNNLYPYINNDLLVALKQPISYRQVVGGKSANGLNAEMLPDICSVYLRARRAGRIHSKQVHFANQAELLLEAFAKTGIIALVDEATGYEKVRPERALQGKFSKYLTREMQPWQKTFPDEFFAELDRLHGMRTTAGNRPVCYAAFINRTVYDCLGDGGLRCQIEKFNFTPSGNRRGRSHQWLSQEGRFLLIEQIQKVLELMTACRNIKHFNQTFERRRRAVREPYLFDFMN
ncbi:hypothetical protein HCZ30_15690 [Marivivens donghaensis]|uniref:Bacteriophage Mx8 p63 C-terminal domain-containing protein n=1 Tax=Marivivens donghaensis TaxID=1699413 RepID=A0ABX0W4M3_9RHOB|nr:P63C domain-containing protein [Marivivens donghaensis]NIY73872.1 hypothetical protein [Marivivens donghaensis]